MAMPTPKPAPERRLVLTVLLLVGLPSIALAAIGLLYVSEAKTFVEQRHRESARELALDVAARLQAQLLKECRDLDAGHASLSVPCEGDADGLRFPRPTLPTAWDLAWSTARAHLAGRWALEDPVEMVDAFPAGSAERLACLLHARERAASAGAPMAALDERVLAEASQALGASPWGAEALLRLGLEVPSAQGPVLAMAWQRALPDPPPAVSAGLLEDLARRFPDQDLGVLRRAQARRTAELEACERTAAWAGKTLPAEAWRMALLEDGTLALARKEASGWKGGAIPSAALAVLMGELAGVRSSALGLTCAASPSAGRPAELSEPVASVEGLRVHLLPLGGPAPSRLGDLRAVLYVWAVVLLMALVAAGSWVVIRSVRREARQVQLRSDLLSSISHELKTPLTSIRMFVDTLLMGRVESPEETRECLSMISRETERLSRLIEQVLTLARLEGGARRIVRSRVALAGLLDDACDSVQAEAGGAGIRIARDLAGAPQDFPMDRGAMSEVLTNLLSNAVKYSGRGRSIRLEARTEAGGLLLGVTDSGPGVPAEERGRLFGRFFRGSAAAASGAEGTGLGLAIVKALAEGHSGRAWVEGAEGGGSRFLVWIPSTEALEPAHA